ncbi:PREDICTED: POTE ankyrin domain family member C-like [Dipodomys ordii]|uniref:POTE ankyrin domain family member C-like n=1 Tax=Dipodomys ordii TaxID=10020 RepID=A0A1S3GIE6_DIPOR|nr:PREDICTED: POTE ankyrin domain family member C-like [Dipodomys ordii]
MKKIFGFGIKERTPLGFCDGNKSTSLQSGNENIDSHYWRNFYAKYKPKEKLHKAASTGKVEKLVSILDSGKIHVDNRDKKNRTALHLACACGHVKVVTFLIANDCEIDLCDSDNSTALIKAVQCQEEECATILLKHGADSNIEDVSGFTALHYAVCNGNSPMVTKLLAYNANIEAKTKDHLTPFLLALRESKVHVADLLIRKGANIHALDEFRRNALMYAVRCESKDMIALLLQRGIEVSHQDGFGWTALQYAAASRSRIWNILLNYEEHELNNLQESNTASSSSEDNSLTRCSDEPFPQVFSSISKQGDGNSHSKSISESFPEKSIANFLGDAKQIGENTEDQMEGLKEEEDKESPRNTKAISEYLGSHIVTHLTEAADPRTENVMKGPVRKSPKMLSSMKTINIEYLVSKSTQPIIEKKGSTTTKANAKQDKELFKSDLSADLELSVTLEKSGKRFDDSENNHTQIKEKMKIHKSNEMEVAENPCGDGAVATETGILHRKSEKAHCQQFPDQEIEEHDGSELPNPKLKVTMKKLARKTEQLQTTLQMTEEDKEQLNKFLEIKACLERCLEKKRKENTELEKDLTRFKKYFEESGTRWETENMNSCSVSKKNLVTQKPEDCEEEMRGRNVKVQGINEDPGTYSEASKTEEDQQRVWNWHPAPMTGGRESGRPQSKVK